MRRYGFVGRGSALAVFGLAAVLAFDGCWMEVPDSWGSPKAPANPTMADVRAAATDHEMHMLRKTAECEQPGNGAHPWHTKYGPKKPWRTRWQTPSGWRYVGAYGMYSGTYGIGARISGVRRYPPAATPAEQSFVALAVARKFGWSAWDCN